MESSLYEPKTLQEAIVYFADQTNCLEYLVARRPEWKTGVICPRCGSTKVGFLKKQLRWQCSVRHPRRQFSIKVGTIFEDSPLGLDKWLPAVWLLHNSKNGISSCEIAKALGVTQKTAWFMLHRIRLAQQNKRGGGKLGGEVEVDETFIGGKARNMHAAKRAEKIQGRGAEGKEIVFGMVERGGKVVTGHVDSRKRKTLEPLIREHVEAGAAIFSDELKSYDGLSDDYKHAVINHAVEYVNGNIHTNTMENFWSLLKRGLKGTYISVEPFHLFRYLDEQAWRYNYRNMDDAARFNIGVEGDRWQAPYLQTTDRQDRNPGNRNAVLNGRAAGSGRLDLSLRPAPMRIGIDLLAVGPFAPHYQRMRNSQKLP
jgi:transposase-like protein